MTAYEWIRIVHIPVALPCLPLFWVAMLSRKGGRVHVLAGRVFCGGMIFTALTGMLMAAIRMVLARDALVGGGAAGAGDRLATGLFLFYLGAITLVPVTHGWRVARTRRDPTVLARLSYRLFLWSPLLLSLLLVGAASRLDSGATPLLYAMSPIGVFLSIAYTRYVKTPRTPPRRWFFEHLAAMLAGGIAAHTAGAVFVLSLLDVRLRGPVAALPWLLPTAIGVPAIFLVSRHYRQGRK